MKPPKASPGFTLLELLVAVTITLVLAGLMLTVVINTLNLWRRTQDGFSTATQAKLVLDMLELDFQAAPFRQDGVTWLAADVSDAAGNLVTHGWLVPATPIKPGGTESRRLVPITPGGATPSIADARFGLSGAWVRFITTNFDSTTNGGSSPVAVSYQLARRPLTGAISAATKADVRYTLFRSAVNSPDSFAAGNNVLAAEFGSSSVTPGAARSTSTITNPNTSDALATNVVDFGIWLYVRDSGTGGLRRIFPADNGDFTHAAREAGTAGDANRFPEVVDVMVRIMTGEGATQLAAMEGNPGQFTRPDAYDSDAKWWWAVVEANSRVYIRRIEVKGTAP